MGSAWRRSAMASGNANSLMTSMRSSAHPSWILGQTDPRSCGGKGRAAKAGDARAEGKRRGDGDVVADCTSFVVTPGQGLNTVRVPASLAHRVTPTRGS